MESGRQSDGPIVPRSGQYHEPSAKEIRHTPLLWMLVFVPAVLIAARIVPAAHTLLFVLAVLAIVPLAALLSHATEAVSEKTGDAVGGLLNATLGNLTELIIAVTALHAGEYMLVKHRSPAPSSPIPFSCWEVFSAGRTPVSCSGVQSCRRQDAFGIAADGDDCAP